MKERTLVLIKPDAVAKRLIGHIISDFEFLRLKMIGLKLLNVKKELAEKHYKDHEGKGFYDELIKYITGEFHNSNVVAIVYEGENAIKQVRDLVGATNPDKADSFSLRGKYGKVHSIHGWHETVIHASDSQEAAEREISLWFSKEELVE